MKYGLERLNADVAAWMRGDCACDGSHAAPPYLAMGDASSVMWNRQVRSRARRRAAPGTLGARRGPVRAGRRSSLPCPPALTAPVATCMRVRAVPEPAAPVLGPRRAAASVRPRPARRRAPAGATARPCGAGPRAVRAGEVHDAAGAPPRVQRAAGHAGDAGRAAAGRRAHAAGRPAGPRRVIQ